MSDFLKDYFQRSIGQKYDKYLEFFNEFSKKKKTISEMKSLKTNDGVYIIDKLIVKNGINLVLGFYRSGKTWFVLDMIKHLIFSENYYSFKINKDSFTKILYVNFENPEELIKNRLETLGFEDTDKVDFVCRLMVNVDNDETFFEQLKNVIKGRYDLVIFDPMRALLMGDENKSAIVRRFFSLIKKYFCDNEITVILTHHIGKVEAVDNGSEDVIKRPRSLQARGSSDIGASSDSILMINRISSRDSNLRIIVEQDKNIFDKEIEGFELLFEDFKNPMMKLFSLDKTKSEKLIGEIMEVLEDEGRISREEILSLGKNVGLSIPQIQRVIRTLKGDGTMLPHKQGRTVIYIKTNE